MEHLQALHSSGPMNPQYRASSAMSYLPGLHAAGAMSSTSLLGTSINEQPAAEARVDSVVIAHPTVEPPVGGDGSATTHTNASTWGRIRMETAEMSSLPPVVCNHALGPVSPQYPPEHRLCSSWERVQTVARLLRPPVADDPECSSHRGSRPVEPQRHELGRAEWNQRATARLPPQQVGHGTLGRRLWSRGHREELADTRKSDQLAEYWAVGVRKNGQGRVEPFYWPGASLRLLFFWSDY